MTNPIVIVKEKDISRERARDILSEAGLADLYDPSGDYAIGWDADNTEYLMEYGYDTPLAVNHSTTAW